MTDVCESACDPCPVLPHTSHVVQDLLIITACDHCGGASLQSASAAAERVCEWQHGQDIQWLLMWLTNECVGVSAHADV